MYPIFIYDDNVFYKQKYKSVNKKELIDIVAKKSGMTKTETESLVTIALETIVESVAKGDRVTLVGFGSFEARERKARYGFVQKIIIHLRFKEISNFIFFL